MKVLFWGSLAFCLAFLLHFIIWKVHLPKRQTKIMMMIFCGVLITVVFTLYRAQVFIGDLGLPILSNLPEYLHVCIYFISLTLAYVVTYSAIEVDSPSLIMIIAIARAGREGFAEKEFEKIMTDDFLIKPRLDDLVIDKMAYLGEAKYRLTKKGLTIARIILFYRKILNLGKGG